MVTLFRLVAGLLFKLASNILLVMVAIWLIGFLYPIVAVAVGVPQHTFYDFVASIVHAFTGAIHNAQYAAQCAG